MTDDWMTDEHKAAALEGFLTNPVAVEYSRQRAADAERYREGLRLTGRELPNHLLDHFDRQWPSRERWNVAQAVSVEFATDRPEMLDMVEKHLRRDAAIAVAERERCMVSTTGPQWVQRPDVSQDLEPNFTREAPWQRGTPMHEWAVMLVCRMSGQSVPLFVEEPS